MSSFLTIHQIPQIPSGDRGGRRERPRVPSHVDAPQVAAHRRGRQPAAAAARRRNGETTLEAPQATGQAAEHDRRNGSEGDSPGCRWVSVCVCVRGMSVGGL